MSYKDWYERNKEKLAEKRKKRYNTDPEYRERTKRSSRESYHKCRVQPPVDRRTIVDETGERYFSIGRIAKLIGREPDTVRKLHKQGVLPDPAFYDPRGWRLYTRAQAMLIRQVFRRLEDREDMDVRTLADVRDILRAEWHTTLGGESGEG